MDVDGPLVAPRAENIVVCVVLRARDDSVQARPELSWQPTFEKYGVGAAHRFRVQDSANRASITDTKTGAMLRCVGSDPARAHGLAPALVLADEVAKWPAGNVHAMISALETSRGKIPNSRLFWLGTRPASGTHPFEKMLQA